MKETDLGREHAVLMRYVNKEIDFLGSSFEETDYLEADIQHQFGVDSLGFFIFENDYKSSRQVC